MDATYEALVAVRDGVVANMAGLFDADTDAAAMREVVSWDTLVCSAKTSREVCEAAGVIPEVLNTLYGEVTTLDGKSKVGMTGMQVAFQLLTAQNAVVGYVVPPTKTAKEPVMSCHPNKNGGPYVAKPGRYSVNFNGGVSQLMFLDGDIAAIKAVLRAAILDSDSKPAVEVVPVASETGASHKFRRVVKCGGYTLGDECHQAAVMAWLAK